MMDLEIQRVECPLCKGVYMKYNKKYQFWSCPECHAEVWPDVDNIKKNQEQLEENRRIQEYRDFCKWAVGSVLHKEILSLVPVAIIKSSKSGKKRKKPLKKLKPWEVQ